MKVVVVRDFDRARGCGKIGAVAVRINPNRVKDHQGVSVVPVAVRSVDEDDAHGEHVIVTLIEGHSIYTDYRDVLEVGEAEKSEER